MDLFAFKKLKFHTIYKTINGSKHCELYFRVNDPNPGIKKMKLI